MTPEKFESISIFLNFIISLLLSYGILQYLFAKFNDWRLEKIKREMLLEILEEVQEHTDTLYDIDARLKRIEKSINNE